MVVLHVHSEYGLALVKPEGETNNPPLMMFVGGQQ